jgi:hypothetical protein
MAQGDVTVFDAHLENVWDGGVHDFGATPNTLKCALIKSAANGGDDPDVADADPRWGAGGTTNFATAEVTAGGNYTAGGATMATPSASLATGVLQVDAGDPATWSQNASNPTNARWAIVYDDTVAGKHAICFIDLGSDFDMTTGDLTITLGAPWFTVNQA